MIEQTGTVAKGGTVVGVGVAGTSYTYLGLPMADLVGLITIVYLLVQIVVSVRKAFGSKRHEPRH